MITTNAREFITGINRYRKLPERIIRKRVMFAVQFLHEGVTSKTPVHTGAALRNWQWTVGTPSGTKLPDPGGVAPGPTNSMPLGPEPRRARAQADSDESFSALKFTDPFQVFYLTNNDDDIMNLEYGKLPTPERSRSPAGMARVTMKELEVAIRGMK
jgi:hypothetical protein